MERTYTGTVFRDFQEIPCEKNKVCRIKKEYRILGKKEYAARFLETISRLEFLGSKVKRVNSHSLNVLFKETRL